MKFERHERMRMTAKLARIQVLCGEADRFYQLQRELKPRESAVLAGILARIGDETRQALEKGFVLMLDEGTKKSPG